MEVKCDVCGYEFKGELHSEGESVKATCPKCGGELNSLEQAAAVREVIAQHNNGTSAYHRISFIPGYPVVTDGVKAVAEAAEAFWFLDIIGSYQIHRRVAGLPFQIWKLEKEVKHNGNEIWTVICREDRDAAPVVKQVIGYSDFPCPEGLKLYCINNVILLPGEY